MPRRKADRRPVEDLPADEVARLLRRAGPLRQDPEDRATFSMRDRSLPPPRTGEILAFPPVERQDAAPFTSQPLRIVRYTPEIGAAPFLSVTFSQPMIELAESRDYLSGEVPVRLTPEPSGRWRWIGTTTLIFEPDRQFPMATRYRVEVPAGIKSVLGNELSEAMSWEFVTTPPRLVNGLPDGQSVTRDPVLYLEFDQRIDAAALASRIRLRSGDREWAIRQATREEIEADKVIAEVVKTASPGRWIALRLDRQTGNAALPTGTNFTVEIAPGLPSAEGPLSTTETQLYSFKTHSPLELVDFNCGWNPKGGECGPGDFWRLKFNNPIAEDFDEGLIRIRPAIPETVISRMYDGFIHIRAESLPRTKYAITISGRIRDIHGQELGRDIELALETSGMEPGLNVPGRDGMVVLDPTGRKRIPVYSVNHDSFKVRLYAVGPDDFGAYSDALRARADKLRERKEPSPFPEIGRLVVDQTFQVDARPDEITVTHLDLAPALKNDLGHALLIVEPTINVTTYYGPLFIVRWIQSTGIALDAFSDRDSLIVWANSLKDGRPLEGVSIDMIKDSPVGGSLLPAPAMSSSNGTVRFDLPAGDEGRVIVASKGQDTVILTAERLPLNPGWNWKQRPRKDSLLWHVIDDRGIYRPGEDVRIKGWVRRSDSSPLGDIGLARGIDRRLQFVLKDVQENEIKSGTVLLSPLGGFDLMLNLPATVNPGRVTLRMIADGDKERLGGLEYEHGFQVQEFRRPEFEVRVTAGEGPYFVGGHAEVALAAGYYTGGALPDSEVAWTVNTDPTNFTPPNRSDFTFGKWIPWWSESSESGDSEEHEGRTDADGRQRLRIDFDSVDPPRPSMVYVLGRVEDVNRQNLAGSTAFLVHPADLYVGLRSRKLFVERGSDLVVESIVTDLDGTTVQNREIRMRAVRVDWKYEKEQWRERESDPQTCVVKSMTDPVICRFAANLGGRYRITADILDDQERCNQSELTLWVSGGGSYKTSHSPAQEKIELIPDRKEYRSGETAEILVQAPFAPAEGLVTLIRGGIVTTGRFRVESGSYTLRIPIEEKYIPNIIVRVDLVGETWRTDEDGNRLENLPQRPAFATGQIDLAVPPVGRKLTVTATPRVKDLEPGGSTSVAVTVRNAEGRPVAGSEVTLIVVDEAVLSLTDYRLIHPVDTLYRKRDMFVYEQHSRNNLDPAQATELLAQNDLVSVSQGVLLSAGMGGGMAACEMGYTVSVKEIKTRIDFNPLAAFAAAVITDASGRATVSVKLPDNLTRYRVMAIAAAGENSFGIAESSITARLPLMVRPSAPRFLNYGDRFELPVVIQNQTGRPMTVDLAVRASNFIFFEKRNSDGSATAGRRVTVPADERVEVRFPAGTVMPGIARFQAIASSGSRSDAAEIEIPVLTPATTETVAVYGEIDNGAIKQRVRAPKGAIRDFGGLEITTSSTQLQSLTDAALYLQTYPFECAEQISSRILANLAVRDTLDAFALKGLPDQATVDRSLMNDIRRLAGMQNSDGGFGFWRSGETSWPYLSIHVTHALQRAREKGVSVPAEMLKSAAEYLKEIDEHIPSDYPESLRLSLTAYSLYVRMQMGEDVTLKVLDEIRKAGGLEAYPLEALGWLLPGLAGDEPAKAEVAGIYRIINSRAVERAGAASFTTSYGEGAHLILHSDRRTDAVLLGGLIEADPGNSLIPKLARGLLAHRKRGRWMNTQENAFALLALDRYFQTYEKEAPDFIARAWFGEAYAGNGEFRGRSVEFRRISIPMSVLGDNHTPRDVVLAKEGRGRLYYRMGLRYAPQTLRLDAADAGFTVTRTYEAVDDPADVQREEDGTWRIRAGARVRVRLSMVALSSRYHVALVDPLPAGFEALNPELATTEDLPEGDLRWRRWFEHQNMRDDRVEAFTTELPGGIYTYVYYARTTTPGIFQVAPAKAEEMYAPETFGRSGSTRVIIE
ncbi:MAG: alpha-2-macroglobulin family protein [Blastocatellales bacterium]